MVLYMCKQEMDKLVTLWDLHRFDCHDGGVIIEQSSGSGIGVGLWPPVNVARKWT